VTFEGSGRPLMNPNRFPIEGSVNVTRATRPLGETDV
jgi:hypothetical protein